MKLRISLKAYPKADVAPASMQELYLLKTSLCFSAVTTSHTEASGLQRLKTVRKKLNKEKRDEQSEKNNTIPQA